MLRYDLYHNYDLSMTHYSGTANGTVRVLVQSPEHHTHGLRSLQLLQTYKVHTSPIISVQLTEKFLISCCYQRHVRAWSM